ncbi:NADPH-dependent F420 reductase [Nocardioides baculatus]|uniref:NADPH-dependent F420 reductase n=1 Tax=Nocardioides baculatus TaxID=2801337 RepID=A0ABS1LDJ8_9ACTN|nr:NADPH-dependent F420 reductase [Nocardioides baculatus]MBL0749705.1 NADPH-dependent F420 reductase [Nocardioides baculatus]
MTTIGLIGSGHIGTAIARRAIEQGHDVVLSNSRGPETLSDLVAELGPRARAATASEAGEAGDLVVVTVPFKAYLDVPVEPLAGKVVIDTNNYYFERDGHYAELDEGRTSVSEMLAAHLPTSKVVKAFNAIQAAHIVTEGRPAGAENRRALAIAGDDADAKAVVTDLIESFGFDVVDAGPLAEGKRFDRDKPAYGAELDADGLREALAAG